MKERKRTRLLAALALAWLLAVGGAYYLGTLWTFLTR